MSAIRKIQRQLLTEKGIPDPKARRVFESPSLQVKMKKKKKKRRSDKGGGAAGPKSVIDEVFSEEEGGDEKRKQRKKEKRARKRKFAKIIPEEARELDSSDSEDEEGPEAWNPPEIMEHLKDAAVVGNMTKVIASIKGEEEGSMDDPKDIVWDGGKTKKGKESNQNLFLWLQAYAGHECVKKRKADDLIFEK